MRCFFKMFVLASILFASLTAYATDSCKQLVDHSLISSSFLENFIKRCHIHSNEQLIPLLPREYLTYYVRIYKTQSDEVGITEEKPRLVLFGEEANVVLSFSGDVSDQQFKIMETNPITGKSELYEFDFGDKKNTKNITKIPQMSEKNPSECLGCHKGDPRPNWDAYFLWPGVYGSEDDLLFESTNLSPIERAKYKKYLAESKTNPRYKYLIPVESHHPPLKPNDLFTVKLNAHNATRIAERFIHDPKIYPYRYALLAASVCVTSEVREELQSITSYLPDKINQRFLKTFSKILSETSSSQKKSFLDRVKLQKKILGTSEVENSRISATEKFLSGTDPDYSYKDYSYNDESVAAFRYLLENQGYETKDWSMQFSLNPNDSGGYVFHSGDGGGLGGMLKPHLLELLDPSSEGNLISLLSDFKATVHTKGSLTCDLLKKKSLEALSEKNSKCEENTTGGNVLNPKAEGAIKTGIDAARRCLK